MNTFGALRHHAHLIQQALDDLDLEEKLAGANVAVIEAERETLVRLLARIEERLFAAAA